MNKDQSLGMKENMLKGYEKEKALNQTDDVLGALNNQNYEFKKPPQTSNLLIGQGNSKKEKDVKKWLKRI